MKVAILLGINCAFNPGDTVAVTLGHLQLDHEIPHVDFRRVKNAQRRAAALWPETVEAIREYCEKKRRPAVPNERKLVLTQYQQAYTKAGEARKLGEGFRRLLVKAEAYTPGVSLGSLRHTFATVVDEYHDDSAIDLVMGHKGKTVRKRVYKQLHLGELRRLSSVSGVVRKWLYRDEVNDVA